MQQREPWITVVIPAWNESDRIGVTLQHLRTLHRSEGAMIDEIIVVDDGSSDDSWRKAERFADRVIRHARRRGKGAALETGWRVANGDVLVFLDADLGESVVHAGELVQPVLAGKADMTIAKLPPARTRGGFGLVKGLAVGGIYHLSGGGFRPEAPLSGQRALRREVLESIGGLAQGFGIEVGLTIDALRRGYKVLEVEVPFRHRETGRNLSGFVHRGRQFWWVGMALLQRWRHPV